MFRRRRRQLITDEHRGVVVMLNRRSIKPTLTAWACVMGMVVAGPAIGQAPPELVAAAWCPVYSGDREDGAPGCDVGVGLALQRWDRWALVAAVGSKTVGGGVAWVVGNSQQGRPIAVSLGAIAPYDERGVDVGRWAWAVGATVSFGKPRR